MDDLIDSGRSMSKSSHRAMSGKKTIRDSSLSDGSSDGRSSVKKKKESGFKKWLKEKFASCFGTTNQTTDLSDGFMSNSPTHPGKGGKVNW